MNSIFGDTIEVYPPAIIPSVMGMQIKLSEDSLKRLNDKGEVYIAFDLDNTLEMLIQIRDIAENLKIL